MNSTQIRALAKQAWQEVERPRLFMLLCVVGIVAMIVFPSDLESYRTGPPDRSLPVVATDKYLRFVNTAAQAALPFLMRDPVGIMQDVYVAVGTTVATHGLKRLLDQWTIWDARLGERPGNVKSQHNMPSGHSSMASCAVYFVPRRYGWWHLLYLIPIMLLTMYARVQLEAHTIPAVIAGMLVGLLVAALFTGRRKAPAAGAPPDAVAAN